MKKLLSMGLIAMTLTMTVPSTSHALVGAVTLNGPVALAGLAMTGLPFFAKVGDWDLGAAFGLLIISGVGLVVLEDGQSMSFQIVTAEGASKLGLTFAEMESFNAEIDQANTLLSHVIHELDQSSHTGVDVSKEIWASVKDSVSHETFSAMQKIVSQK